MDESIHENMVQNPTTARLSMVRVKRDDVTKYKKQRQWRSSNGENHENGNQTYELCNYYLYRLITMHLTEVLWKAHSQTRSVA